MSAKKCFPAALCLVLLIFFLIQVDDAQSPGTSTPHLKTPTTPLNIAPGVRYVGSNTCGACHAEIAASFRKTDMGVSMRRGDSTFVANLTVPAKVYDKELDQYFEVSRKDGQIYQSQYALDLTGKELFRQDMKLDYLIGAGENGLSFVVDRDHYLFEAPLSYYTKSQEWGFSPGYDIHNRGFTRPIRPQCITCHSGHPNPSPDPAQLSLYEFPPFDELAVGCENCHGPGELHVAKHSRERGPMLTGQPDPTIVNPARLDGWLADNICMRCHQAEDVRVDKPDTQEADFRPGMELDHFVSIFAVPPKSPSDPSSRLLEHYFGMTLSKCYTATAGGLHCISCHSPHVEPAGAAAVSYYRSRCLECHTEQSCTLSHEKRLATSPPDNCISCHMPKTAITTITHASLTDHTIPANPAHPAYAGSESARINGPKLLHLTAPYGERSDLNSVPPLTLLEAYDHLVGDGHEEFKPQREDLLNRLAHNSPSSPLVLRDLAQRAIDENTAEARLKAIRYMTQIVHEGKAGIDDYTLLATLYGSAHRNREAVEMLEKARALNPYLPEIYRSLAVQYLALEDYRNALATLQKGIALFPGDLQLRNLDKQAGSATLDDR